MANSYECGRERAHSKVLEKLAKKSVYIERYYCDVDGHWIDLKAGWKSAYTDSGLIRGDTVQEVKDKWNFGIVPDKEHK